MSKYNTFIQRFVAGIIDVFLLTSLSSAFMIVFDVTDLNGWVLAEVFTQLIFIFYLVFSVGKFGQTIGKYIMSIKVYSLDEQSVIGYKRAFYREFVPILINVVILVLFITNSQYEHIERIDVIGGWIGYGWFILELVTMLTNRKRRAIHDFMASSVVVNLRELQREMDAQALQKNIP